MHAPHRIDADTSRYLHAPRCSARPLPDRAFLPGVDPIPAGDPSEPRADHASPTASQYHPEPWSQDDDYLYGCDLFNHGYWWEAHNAWEQVWNRYPAESQQAHLVQALIQAANALLKHRMSRPRAVHRLVAETARHVQIVGDARCMGLDARAWYKVFRQYATTLPDAGFPEPGFPYLSPVERS